MNPDPLAELRAQLAAGKAASAPAAVPTAVPTPAPAPVHTASLLEKVELTGEHVFERLHYFESLATYLLEHVKVLRAQVSRTGTAPATAYFKPLKSPAGDFDPNVG